MSVVPQERVDSMVAELETLDHDQFVLVVETVMSRVAPADQSRTLGLLMRVVLSEDEEVERLAGPPVSVHSVLDEVFVDLRIKAMARRVVLAEDLLESSAVAAALGFAGANTREAASDLRRKGTLLGLPAGRRFLYPAFQIDPVEQRVKPIVAQVNRRLGALSDPWGAASWWVSAHPRLSGAAPKDLLGSAREPDLAVLAGIAQG